MSELPWDDHDVNNERISHKSSQTNKPIEEGQDDHDEGGDFVEVGLVNFEAAVGLGRIDKT